MDGIVPFRGDHQAPSPGRFAPTAHQGAPLVHAGVVNPAVVKTPGDYLRALRRRIWMVLAVAVPLGMATSIVAIKQPRVYKAYAEIVIDPPQIDPILSTLVAHEIGNRDPLAQEKYVPNHAAFLRTKGLAESTVSDPRVASEVKKYDDPAQELILNYIEVKQQLKSNLFVVSLEGKDPALTKKLLEIHLEEFKRLADRENTDKIGYTKSWAGDNLEGLRKQLVKLDQDIDDRLRTVPTIGPGGRSIIEDQYVSLGSSLAHKQARLGELSQQFMISQMFPKVDVADHSSHREEHLATLEAERKRWTAVLKKTKRTARNFDGDPATREYAQRLSEVLDELNALSTTSIKTKMAGDPTEMILDQYRTEIENDKAQQEALLAQMQQSTPEHQKFLALLEERTHTHDKIREMDQKLASFEILSQTQTNNVKVPPSVVEPAVPIKPNRTLLIIMGLCLSLGIGIGLVMVLEHIDHSVKVPEHLTQGLTLPLLGVVPRIRRTARTHRGGHLWTSATPDSLEADAFRNIRASLLGISDRRGPIVTLLITSPKAGDGKSTAALNLAATCARAGERTLLLDVDLRRPTLDAVFPANPERKATSLGLVDILRGSVAWQQTLRRTELNNLDFIATGDTRNIPIEILGTLELRQLLTALSHHYNRVILDGPAVLGLADCRTLGRMVDASLLVVRSGAHQLTTLLRAKTMLEQSHVAIAGVVVNGLNDDVHNWASYGYEPAILGYSGKGRAPGKAGAALGSTESEEALVLAG